jgi:hypothetical protein
VFSIISLNYSAYAKTLMESLSVVHPEWDRHVLLVDRCDQPAALGGRLFETTLVEDLPLPNKRAFLFRYDIMELNTAVKPSMFACLRERGYQRVVYLDPDILVLDRLVELELLLDDGAAVVVTPHLTAPLDDGFRPSEFDILQAGTYNLGFLAIADRPAADSFIAWWRNKLEYGAASDQEGGLFTDQKWVDLAPGMFGGFALLRDPGYNLAYWNIAHRPVTKAGGYWLAGGSKLRFFHFSGFDPADPALFSRHQNRYSLANIGPARELATDYAAKLLQHGYLESRSLPYAFGAFSDGTPIPSAIRWMYRKEAALSAAAGADPFACVDVFLESDYGGLPIVMRGVWSQHRHVQRVFPDQLGGSRAAFLSWFFRDGAREHKIPDAFLRSARLAVNRPVSFFSDSLTIDQIPADASIWARGLAMLHWRATGGLLSQARWAEYRQVDGLVAFLRLAWRRWRKAGRPAPHAPLLHVSTLSLRPDGVSASSVRSPDQDRPVLPPGCSGSGPGPGAEQ